MTQFIVALAIAAVIVVSWRVVRVLLRRTTSPMPARALAGTALAVTAITSLLAVLLFDDPESSTLAIAIISATPVVAAGIALLATINRGYLMLCAQGLMVAYLMLYGVVTVFGLGPAYLCAAVISLLAILFNFASGSERRGGAGRLQPHA